MMPFPPRDPNAPPKPKKEKGDTKTRKYAVWYDSRKSGGADESTWSVGEFKGYSIHSVHLAVVRHLRAQLNKPELEAGDVMIMEAHVLPPRTSLDKYLEMLGYGADEEE